MFQIEQKNIKPTDSAIFMMSSRCIRLKRYTKYYRVKLQGVYNLLSWVG